MQQLPLSEKKSFSRFLLLVIVTAFNSLMFSEYFIFLGVTTILWGLLSLLRFVYLNQSKFSNIPKLFNLPTQILFGVEKIENKYRQIILDRLSKTDVLIFAVLGLAFLAWVIYNAYSPADFAALDSLRIQQAALTKLSLTTQSNFYDLIAVMAHYVITALVMLIAMSYSQHYYFFKKMIIFIFPQFIACMVMLILNGYIVTSPISPYLSQLKGFGAGQAENLARFAQIDLSHSLSPFIMRYIENGFIGAYGLYALFIPALFMLIKTYRDRQHSRLICFIGLATLIHLWAIDVFWLLSSFTSVMQLLGLMIVGLCWGAAVQDKRSLTKEQM